MNSANGSFEQFEPEDSSKPMGAQGQTPAALLPCDEVADLIPAHSIGATDPEEAAVVRARLGACNKAAAELADYSKIAETLLYTAPVQRAPAQLANRLRESISTRPATPAHVNPLTKRPSPVMSRPAAVANHNVSPLLMTPAPKPARRWTFLRTAAAAASLLLVGLNMTLLVQNQQLRAHQEEIAAELAQQNRALIFLAAEEPHEVILPAAQENSLAQADVLWNSSLGVAVVYVRAFPELPPDKAYQIWLNKDGQRTSPGLFTVENGGMGIFVFSITEPLDSYDAIGITPEPASGSLGPTAPPVVRGPV